jgi:squalene cyclase
MCGVLIGLGVAAVWVGLVCGVGTDDRRTPEERALAYLASEVPRWSIENKCYSCHHNGDGGRALLVGQVRGFAVPNAALLDTRAWLVSPGNWDQNSGDGPFSDKQFASALATAVQNGEIADRRALRSAANRVAEDQADDGSWQLSGVDTVGSPTTYGRALGTAVARSVLHAGDPARHRERVERADGWLGLVMCRTVADAAAVLSAHDATTPAGRRALDWLLQTQGKDGGWGCYRGSPPEAFDTALAVLAIVRSGDPAAQAAAARGRGALVASQMADGSWVETTRPAGAESYAQRVSTTAWATLALLATTRERDVPDGEAREVPAVEGR